MKNRGEGITQGVLAMLLLTAALGAGSISLWKHSRADLSLQSWAQTTGQLNQFSLDDQVTGYRGGTTFRINVQYEYAVEGTKYVGTKFHALNPNRVSGNEAAVVRDRLAAGSSVPVYYDPSNPNSASLTRGSNGSGARLISYVLAGLVVALWSVFLLRTAWTIRS